MLVTMYEDTQTQGHFVLIADNGKVSFIEQVPADGLAFVVLRALWSNLRVHVDTAHAVKGRMVASATVPDLGEDMPIDDASRMLQAVNDVLVERKNALAKAAACPTPYTRAVGFALCAGDAVKLVLDLAKLASNDINASSVTIRLLVQSLLSDRLVTSEALFGLLTQNREVIGTLQTIAWGNPATAREDAMRLLDDLGMVDGCPGCGEKHDSSEHDNVTSYTGHEAVPGTSRVH